MIHIKIVDGYFCTVLPYIPPAPDDTTLGWMPHHRISHMTPRMDYMDPWDYASTKEDKL